MTATEVAPPRSSRLQLASRSARTIISTAVVLAAGLATFLAASPWLQAYQMPRAVYVLAAAAALSILIPVVVGGAGNRPAGVSYACSALGLVALLAASVALNPANLVRGLVDAPSRLVTDTLPLSHPIWLLVPAVVATWITGAAVSELLTRTSRSDLPAAVLVASYVGAYAASSGAPHHDAAAGGLLFLLLAAIAIGRRLLIDAERPAIVAEIDVQSGDALRSVLAWSGLAIAVAVLAGLVVPVLPGMRATPAAVARATTTDNVATLAPVGTIAALRDGDPQAPAVTLFTVALGGPSTGYLPVATLDNYDGDIWTFDRTFKPTGGRIPPPPAGSPNPAATTARAELRQSYSLLTPFEPLLPFLTAADRPVEVRGLAVDAEVASAMVVPSQPIRLPVSYTVVSAAPAATLERVPAASAIAADTDASDRQLPGEAAADLTGVLRYLAAETGQRPAPTIGFLQSVMVAWQRDDTRIEPAATAPSAAGGTSLDEVLNAVTVDHAAGPEQFATLFAVIARFLGVPARLATGFRIEDPGAAPGLVAPGSHSVTNREAWTWVEIPVVGDGWVVADPTPIQGAAGPAPVASGVQSPTTTVVPGAANALPASAGTHALAPPVVVTLPRPVHRSLPLLLVEAVGLVLLAIVVLVAGAFGVAAARRVVRRRSRRGGRPDEAAVGAWLELLDDLRRAGVEPADAASATEVATLAGEHFGAELADTVLSVGGLADQALYFTRSTVDSSVVQASWEKERDLCRQVRATLAPRQRARAALAVGVNARRRVAFGRPLRRRRGHRDAARSRP